MMVIGLTGSIGSGKSTLAAMLKNANIPVVDADELSRQVTRRGEPILSDLANVFGKLIINNDGTLNRKILGKIVFSDPLALQKLEKITHPAIKTLQKQILVDLQKQGVPIVVYMAPLLFEKNVQEYVDKTILIVANEDILINRITKRDSLSTYEVKQRIDAQMRNDEKIKLADFIIENNGDLSEFKDHFNQIWEKITGKNLLIQN